MLPGEGYWRLDRRMLLSDPAASTPPRRLLAAFRALEGAPSFFRRRRLGSRAVWDEIAYRLADPSLLEPLRSLAARLSARAEAYLDDLARASAGDSDSLEALGGEALARLAGAYLHGARLRAILPAPGGSSLLAFHSPHGLLWDQPGEEWLGLLASGSPRLRWRSGRLLGTRRNPGLPLSDCRELPGFDRAALRLSDPRSGRRLSFSLSELPSIHSDERSPLPGGRRALLLAFGSSAAWELEISAETLLALPGLGAARSVLESQALLAALPAPSAERAARGRAL